MLQLLFLMLLQMKEVLEKYLEDEDDMLDMNLTARSVFAPYLRCSTMEYMLSSHWGILCKTSGWRKIHKSEVPPRRLKKYMVDCFQRGNSAACSSWQPRN